MAGTKLEERVDGSSASCHRNWSPVQVTRQLKRAPQAESDINGNQHHCEGRMLPLSSLRSSFPEQVAHAQLCFPLCRALPGLHAPACGPMPSLTSVEPSGRLVGKGDNDDNSGRCRSPVVANTKRTACTLPTRAWRNQRTSRALETLGPRRPATPHAPSDGTLPLLRASQ